MNVYVFEFIGATMLILIGNGIVANLVLKGTKGADSGWVGISLAWGIAVFIGVFISADVSGAHLNPAVTIGLAIAGKFSWSLVPSYFITQVLGAMMVNLLVWLTYKKQYEATEDQSVILATFSTSPAIRRQFWNLVTEIIGAFTLILSVFYIAGGTMGGNACILRFFRCSTRCIISDGNRICIEVTQVTISTRREILALVYYTLSYLSKIKAKVIGAMLGFPLLEF